MGKLGGFLQIERRGLPYRDAHERAHDYREFLVLRPEPELREQGARCMDCGVPFCHNGCPLGNLIPDWNDLVYRDRWQEAIVQLHATNNFPDFTGRLCPAPCEAACVLEIREGDAVTIKQIEHAIIERAFAEGWIKPEPPRPAAKPARRSPSWAPGPRGWPPRSSCAAPVTASMLLERDEAAGGLVRFGVPDFKIEKRVVERRVRQLIDEGVELRCGVDVGRDLTVQELRAGFDAVVLATGSRVPRDLPVPGRELGGIHFAMDYLYQRNRSVAHELAALGGGEDDSDGAVLPSAPAPLAPVADSSAARHANGVERITAAGKHVVVIGGGDTGADCVGNALREGAASIVQLELLPEPPAHRPDERTPWPQWPLEVPPLLRDGGGARGGRRGAGLRGDHHALQRRRRRRCGSAAHRPRRARAAVRADGRHRPGAARPPGAARDGLPCGPSRPCSTSSESSGTRAATSSPSSPTPPPSRVSSPRATRVVGSR